MRSEMDILKMNKSERFCWLNANRVTLIVVGIVWISMIVEQLIRGDRPWFLISMVPVFALIRFFVYIYYRRMVKK